MTESDGPPSFPLSAQAPGKCILFGEHSVVHGGPELLFAVDLTTQVVVREAARTSLNSDTEALEHNAYLRTALETLWSNGPPIEVRSVSRIPKSAGLGSSAAFVAALATALAPGAPGASGGGLAQRCFDIERRAQGVGSPGDTSASVAGGYLTVNAPGGSPLWTVVDGARTWDVRRVTDPNWVWIVAYSGIPRSTAEAVRAVNERLEREDGPELLRRFADVARNGIAAVARGDRTAVAEQMALNQQLLRDVDVSHPRLEALISAVAPAAEGAKLTGAGRGGSIVVLPKPGRETEALRRLARAGAVPFAVRPSADGAVRVVPR